MDYEAYRSYGQYPDTAHFHDGLELLSAYCDGARAQDGMGFNKADTKFGKDLASNFSLTDRQAHYGYKLVQRYQGQLPEEIIDRAL